MRHAAVLTLLRRHAAYWPDEGELAARFVAFVQQHADCLSRRCVPGHVTASAWILSADGERALLLHHKKLGRWLQLGGHVEDETDLAGSALREAREESGLLQFELLGPGGVVAVGGDGVVPLDLDVHEIPARRDEPAHLHWDVRFLLRALPDQVLAASAEANDMRWFTAAELAQVTDEDSVLRLARKARRWLPSTRVR